MQEKRISVRTHLMGVGARISKDNKTWTDVDVRDISDGGICFISKEEFPRGTTLKLHGNISDFLRTMEIDCDVKVVFTKDGDEQNSYSLGCKFMYLSKAEQTALSIFIELLVTKYPSLLIE